MTGEVGEVIAIEDDKAVIKMQRTEACAKCRACTSGMESKEMIIKAVNICGAVVGDNVEIMLDSADFFRATLIMYGIPFIAFLAGVFGGYYGAVKFNIEYAELVGIGLGIVFVLAAYGIIHTQEYRFKTGGYVPKAMNVVENKN